MTEPAAYILIVDDEVQNRKLLEVLLRPEGYRIDSAASGEEAMLAIAQHPPDLILLDIMMPGMDGCEVAILLKANPATCHIPIIMVTAQIHRSARLNGLNAGAEEFLTKPVDRVELWLRVRNLLRLKALRDQLQSQGLVLQQARNDADAATLAKSSFLAAMSHEIRTPMNGVIGMVDVLQQTPLTSAQVEMVDLIRESAFSLLTIIDDILDFSKIEAGKVEIEYTPIRVADVVEKACGILEQLAGAKGVRLSLFIDPRLPGLLMGDKVRLRQVLLNLIGNAIKFSSGGALPGRVAVKVQVNRIEADQVLVQFIVSDNGIGMDQTTQARLFNPFVQADTSTTRRFGGTGLGLVISRHLIELMAGSLTLDSTPGLGSTFTLELSFAAAAVTTVDMFPNIAGLDCLLIGALQGMAAIISNYLSHDGVRVEKVTGLIEAQQMQPPANAAPWIWIFDAGEIIARSDELRALPAPDQAIRAVMIGSTAPPDAVAAGWVRVEGSVLTQRNLRQAVAVAGGRASTEPATPVAPHHDEPQELPSRDTAIRDRRLVLVAEDNETNQKVILRQLALLGCVGDIAGNGKQALLLWQTGHYALLLTDLHMPEMDGYELTAAIRRQEIQPTHIPIVALSANTLSGEGERCRAVGMDDYLSKPVQLADLKATLQRLLVSPAAALVS